GNAGINSTLSHCHSKLREVLKLTNQGKPGWPDKHGNRFVYCKHGEHFYRRSDKAQNGSFYQRHAYAFTASITLFTSSIGKVGPIGRLRTSLCIASVTGK